MTRLCIMMICAGCAATDPCADYDGACVALEVRGTGSVDQLEIKVAGVASLDGKTPPTPSAVHALPVTTALFFPQVGGAVDIGVTGLLGGNVVGAGTATALLRPGEHQTVIVLLSAFNVDLEVAHDLSSGDRSVGDLSEADLAAEDLSSEDLSQPDLTTLDLVLRMPRYLFVLSARSPILGTLDALDGECTTTAATAGLPPTTYKALIAYPGLDPDTHVTLNEGRDIVLPSNTKVATDSTFWKGTNLLHAINELADATQITGCAWGNFAANGGRIAVPNDCSGWTVADSGHTGAWGDVTAVDTTWSFSGVDTCDVKTCGIYCIQQ
jgi:hypothetical protein